MTDLSAAPPPRPLIWPSIIEQVKAACPIEMPIYLVGGVVRDALRGLPVHDIDLVTGGDGLKTAQTLADRLGGDYYPLDRERRTGRVILGGGRPDSIVIDVASFRGGDLLADLQGRDFTINAIASPLQQTELIIDPLGGASDLLSRKTLRPCSPESFRDDPIRTIRAVRFASQLRLRALPESIAGLREAAPALRHGDELAQPERARDEFFKLLDGPRPAAGLRLLDALGVLPLLMPRPLVGGWETRRDYAFRHIERLDELYTVISLRRDDNLAADMRLGVAVMVLDRYRKELQDVLWQPLPGGRSMRWVGILESLAREVTASPGGLWGNTLRLSREEMALIDQIAAARALPLPQHVPPAALEMHDYYRISGNGSVPAVLATLADGLAMQDVGMGEVDGPVWGTLLDQWASPLLYGYLRDFDRLVRPSALLNGNELQAQFGLEAGPRLGSVIQGLIRAQISGEVSDRPEAIEWVRRFLDDQGAPSR